MGLISKLNLVSVNPAYPSTDPENPEFSTITEVKNLDYDPDLKVFDILNVIMEDSSEVKFEVRHKKPASIDLDTNETCFEYTLSSILPN